MRGTFILPENFTSKEAERLKIVEQNAKAAIPVFPQPNPPEGWQVNWLFNDGWYLGGIKKDCGGHPPVLNDNETSWAILVLNRMDTGAGKNENPPRQEHNHRLQIAWDLVNSKCYMRRGWMSANTWADNWDEVGGGAITAHNIKGDYPNWSNEIGIYHVTKWLASTADLPGNLTNGQTGSWTIINTPGAPNATTLFARTQFIQDNSTMEIWVRYIPNYSGSGSLANGKPTPWEVISNGIVMPKNVSELANDAKYQTEMDVAKAIAAADHLDRVIVNSTKDINLSATDADKHIYMVPKKGAKDGDADRYDEYMVIEGKLEPVGNWEVGLSDYAKKSDLGIYAEKTELFGYATKTEIAALDRSLRRYKTEALVANHAYFIPGIHFAVRPVYNASGLLEKYICAFSEELPDEAIRVCYPYVNDKGDVKTNTKKASIGVIDSLLDSTYYDTYRGLKNYVMAIGGIYRSFNQIIFEIPASYAMYFTIADDGEIRYNIAPEPIVNTDEINVPLIAVTASHGTKCYLRGLASGCAIVQDSSKTVEDMSWGEIREIVAKSVDEICRYFMIGDEKNVMVGDEELTFVINYIGKDNVKFSLKNVMKAKAKMNDTDTNSGGYSKSKMKSTLDSIYNILPDDLKSAITTDLGATKLYLQKKRDMGQTYYYRKENQIKVDSDGNPCRWWLEDAVDGSTEKFYCVDENGKVVGANASEELGICFGFTIGG